MMKHILYKASERGHANHGWLDSYHSFSFGQHHDPDKIHFGALRVLNDDTIKAGYGFPKHPHDNMEIVTIPLVGDLEHKDTTGRHEIIRHNDVQIMSAGSGIEHSEKNASHRSEVKLLQVWVFPKEKNITPRYEQKTFDPANRLNKIQTVVAPDDKEAVWINQDAWFSLASFGEYFQSNYKMHKQGNGVYVFVIEGNVSVNGEELYEKDALAIWDVNELSITANSNTQLLLIEVPLHLN